MDVHIFQCSTRKNRYGLTIDRTGANLPPALCPNGVWVYIRTIHINPGDPRLVSGLLPDEIINHINENGYYIVDIDFNWTERVVPG